MIGAYLKQLGIPYALILQRGLTQQYEANELEIAETDQSGREFSLTPNTSAAWHRMKDAAHQDGIELLMVSAFRSIQRQADIIQEKLNNGASIDRILEVCAPPGFSEHHTGRAIDITCPDDPELEISFENTQAFLWLTKHAAQYGFSMSYPRENKSGFQYEPWHWCFIQELPLALGS
jgi:D-alanyl-D-alanine carboxypeptidase